MSATTIAFDALAYFDRLKTAGMPEAQARIQAEALREQGELCAREIRRAIERYDETKRAELATRGDVLDVRLEIEKVRAEVEKVRAELKTDIEKIRGEVEKVRGELKTDMEKVKFDLLKWQIAGWVALAAIMARGFNWIGF